MTIRSTRLKSLSRNPRRKTSLLAIEVEDVDAFKPRFGPTTLPVARRCGRLRVLIYSSRVGRVAIGSPVIRGRCSGVVASIAKSAARV